MRASASRELLASRADVWGFLAEPYHLADWWPTIATVRPDARGFRVGARWHVVGPSSPSFFRKASVEGLAIVRTIEPFERVGWALTADRLEVEVRLRAVDSARTFVEVVVDGTWRPEAMGRPRALPRAAVNRLYELVQTAASLGGRAAG
jgi:uncharacterized protein YndB with AHSA1/START domain